MQQKLSRSMPLVLVALMFLLLGAMSAAAPQAGSPPVPAAAALEEIDPFVAQLLEEWKVPGLALGVVVDGQVVLLRGYGVRDLESRRPVTPQTLFSIGSSTKSFTATALAMLADEGKLAWDEPVRRYLPDFRLYDAHLTEQITSLDLLTHRSGLPGYNSLWYVAPFTRRELFEKLQYLTPNKPLRAAFQYQNLMYMAAGVLVERLTGSTWEEFVRQRIFRPLGMPQSTFASQVDESQVDVARPYHPFQKSGQLKRVPYKKHDAVGPAGSIVSNAEDLVGYVQFHLASGKQGERQLLSSQNARRLQFPQMVVPANPAYEELGHTSYGLGFFITSYRGHRNVHHGGNIDGFNALFSFLPEKKIGVVVLTNLSFSPVPTILSRNIFDRLLGLEPVDWVARSRQQEAQAKKAKEAAQKNAEKPRTGTSPSHPLREFAGHYEHPAYGTAAVELAGAGLKLTLHGLTYALRHYHFNVFELEEKPDQLEPFGEMQVTFLYNRKGDVDRLAMPLEPAVEDLVFRRVKDSPTAASGASNLSGVVSLRPAP